MTQVVRAGGRWTVVTCRSALIRLCEPLDAFAALQVNTRELPFQGLFRADDEEGTLKGLLHRFLSVFGTEHELKRLPMTPDDSVALGSKPAVHNTSVSPLNSQKINRVRYFTKQSEDNTGSVRDGKLTDLYNIGKAERQSAACEKEGVGHCRSDRNAHRHMGCIFPFTRPHMTCQSGDPPFSHPPMLSDTTQYIGPNIPDDTGSVCCCVLSL